MGDFSHVPVMLEQTIESLKIDPAGIYMDGTTGGGGHSYKIAERLRTGRLFCFDRDEEALAAAAERLEPFADKVTFVKSNYGDFDRVLKEYGVGKLSGILLDLGVSSYQLDTAERGFSYRFDAPLDMRMDRSGGITAADVINTYSKSELIRVLRDYGEEKFAPQIAANILKRREERPVATTGELVEVIRASLPMKILRTEGHPAKKTFQAVRIEVNDELNVLKDVLGRMIGSLAPGGRLSVITFHSLEDRIVKTEMKRAEDPCTCPKNFPVCVCGKVSMGRMITRKPILPEENERENNPRAGSAKLRVFERGTG
ncbi:MAG: 16S rRNA (cytosine(1402)-N(4))-methyltransferase RsmH [Lachnospiraceae bacterium]|nr:16S rRNA (cytosine(1402)-N(4))-methyltransferase RsmH [Lachnospiraceae bacterium]